MGLQDLLHPNFLGPALAVTYLIHRMDFRYYEAFEDKISFLKEDFNRAQENEEYIENVLQRAGMLDEDSRILDVTKELTIEIYESFADKSVPKFFLFSRPWFYLKAKKELTCMKEESEKRLSVLKAA